MSCSFYIPIFCNSYFLVSIFESLDDQSSRSSQRMGRMSARLSAFSRRVLSNEIGDRECPNKKQERFPFHHHSRITTMENKSLPLNPRWAHLPTGHTSCCSTQSGLTRAISKHQQDRRHSFSDWGNFVVLRAFLLAVKVCSRILDRPVCVRTKFDASHRRPTTVIPSPSSLTSRGGTLVVFSSFSPFCSYCCW